MFPRWSWTGSIAPVAEVVDERAAGGDAGEPGGLDRVVVVAEGADGAGEAWPIRRVRIRCARW